MNYGGLCSPYTHTHPPISLSILVRAIITPSSSADRPHSGGGCCSPIGPTVDVERGGASSGPAGREVGGSWLRKHEEGGRTTGAVVGRGEWRVCLLSSSFVTSWSDLLLPDFTYDQKVPNLYPSIYLSHTPPLMTDRCLISSTQKAAASPSATFYGCMVW